jgi:tetratricopeptide (TPR) repeat protein
VFPVLARVNAVAVEQRRIPNVTDSQELRRRASSALRELFARLALRQPTVLVIDDLQWGDADSALLMGQLLRHPEPPSLMLVGCYRSEEVDTSPFLQALFAERKWTTHFHELPLTELTTAESSELARKLLSETGDAARAETIAQESGGSPFLLGQLVQGRSEKSTLEEVLRERIDQLPAHAKSLLEIVAMAGQPIDASVAARAAGVEADQLEAISTLRASRFVRVQSGQRGGRLETYHDRIRASVTSGISAEGSTDIHGRLAVALEADGHADKEVLAVHFQAAGHLAKAAGYAEVAAREASGALAFERAAQLYQMAISLDVTDPLKQQHLRIALATVLSNAGHCLEAAGNFVMAAEGLGGRQAVECRRLAADEYLNGGHIDQGLEQLNHVLHAIGMKLPSTPARAFLALIFWRARLRLRGLHFKERSAAEVPAETLSRIDTCQSVCRGLGLVDSILGLCVQPQHLLLALKAGEPSRIRQALGFELCAAAATQGKGPRTRKLNAICNSLAERAHDPFVSARARLDDALATMLMGEWKNSLSKFAEAEQLLRSSGRADSYREQTLAHLYTLNCLYLMGSIREYASRLPDLLDRYQAGGDLWAEVHLRTHYARLKCFVHDDPDAAEEQLDWVIGRWSHRGFHTQHYEEALIRVQVALYRGQARQAWDLLALRWRSFSTSFLLRVQVIRILLLDLRARTALTLSAGLSDRGQEKRFLKIAEASARRIARDQTAWGDALAELLHAGIAVTAGDRRRALQSLDRAEAQLETAGMELHAAVARRRRGELIGGREGQKLIEKSDQWMQTEGIKNPARLTALIACGRWG